HRRAARGQAQRPRRLPARRPELRADAGGAPRRRRRRRRDRHPAARPRGLGRDAGPLDRIRRPRGAPRRAGGAGPEAQVSQALSPSPEPLAAPRGLVVAHAVGAAFAGLMPIPYLDEWLPSLVRRAMIRRIAEDRGVDLDEAAVRELADGRVPPPA